MSTTQIAPRTDPPTRIPVLKKSFAVNRGKEAAKAERTKLLIANALFACTKYTSIRYTTPDINTKMEPHPIKIPEGTWFIQEMSGSDVQANHKIPSKFINKSDEVVRGTNLPVRQMILWSWEVTSSLVCDSAFCCVLDLHRRCYGQPIQRKLQRHPAISRGRVDLLQSEPTHDIQRMRTDT